MKKNGQALVTLLVFTATAIIMTIAAAALNTAANQTAGQKERAEAAYYAAEAGVHNAIRRLDTEPDYSGETFNLGRETVTVVVVGETNKIITSKGQSGSIQRILQVRGGYSGSQFSVTAWDEVVD